MEIDATLETAKTKLVDASMGVHAAQVNNNERHSGWAFNGVCNALVHARAAVALLERVEYDWEHHALVVKGER